MRQNPRRYIGQNLRQMVDRPDGIFLFRLHKARSGGFYGGSWDLWMAIGCSDGAEGGAMDWSREELEKNMEIAQKKANLSVHVFQEEDEYLTNLTVHVLYVYFKKKMSIWLT